MFEDMTYRERALLWLLLASALAAVGLLTGCADIESAACRDGMTLRHRQGGYVCEGFGAGFTWLVKEPRL